MLACHGGAGFSDNLANACLRSLKYGGGAVATVTRMEDDPLFNCGRGSNLNWDGKVECEAGYMSSCGKFGAVSVVDFVKTPTLLAQCVAENHANVFGLVPPLILTGEGAKTYAQKIGFPLCEPNYLITEKAKSQWSISMDLIGQRKSVVDESFYPIEGAGFDTVGAIEMNDDGSCVACCSSGGILLKHSGRMGQSAVYGAGCWAEQVNDVSVAVVTSGLGEAIIRTQMARGLANAVTNKSEDSLSVEAISRWLAINFTTSKWLNSLPAERRLAGALIMVKELEITELIICNNTPYFPVSYSDSHQKKRILKIPENICGKFSIASVVL